MREIKSCALISIDKDRNWNKQAGTRTSASPGMLVRMPRRKRFSWYPISDEMAALVGHCLVRHGAALDSSK
jgi:hypothetical protein